MPASPIVILDRDGVINEESADYVKAVSEWRPIAGSLDAVAKLNHAGFRVVIATNQSGVGRSLFSYETLNQIHEHMTRELSAHGGFVDAVFFCTCLPSENCSCRKPSPGMLHDIVARTRCDLNSAVMIGDSLRDIEAARSAGVKPILVRTGNGQATEAELPQAWQVAVFDDLASAVEHITREPTAH